MTLERLYRIHRCMNCSGRYWKQPDMEIMLHPCREVHRGKANLDMLIEKARAYESTSYKGLFHFVRYIEQLQKYDVDYGEASIEDEHADTVRVMTIHKSKGLEFPCCDRGRNGKNDLICRMQGVLWLFMPEWVLDWMQLIWNTGLRYQALSKR